MQIVKAGHEHISKKGLSPYQFVERIGRVCYKSEDKITETSAKNFVKGLVSRGHTAMIEHFWVHLTFTGDYWVFRSQIDDFVWNRLKDAGDLQTFFKFMQVTYLPSITFISFPIRAAVDLVNWATELNAEKELDELVPPPLIREMFYELQSRYFDFFREDIHIFSNSVVITNEFEVWNEKSFLDLMVKQTFPSNIEDYKNRELMKHSTHTIKFTINRGASHDIIRHRLCNYAMESTRFCNYGSAKFNGEITVIEPQPTIYNDGNCDIDYQCKLWVEACEFAEKQYIKLLKAGATPEEARGVLPHDLKTDLIITTNETEWQHIINLRAKQITGKAQPQVVEVMLAAYEDLKVLSDGRIV